MTSAVIAGILLSQSSYFDFGTGAPGANVLSNYYFGFGPVRVADLAKYDTVAIVKYKGQIADHERNRYLGPSYQPAEPRKFGADLLEVQHCLKGNAQGVIRAVYRVHDFMSSMHPLTRPMQPNENATYIFFGTKQLGQKLRVDRIADAAYDKRYDYPAFADALSPNEYSAFALFETHVPTLRESPDPKAVFLYAVADAFRNANDRTVELLCKALRDLVTNRSDEPVPDIEGITSYDWLGSKKNWFQLKFTPVAWESRTTLLEVGKFCLYATLRSENLSRDKDRFQLAVNLTEEYIDFMARSDAEQKFSSFPSSELYWIRSFASPSLAIRNKIVDMIFTARSPNFKRFMLDNWLMNRPSDQNVSRLVELLNSDSVVERGSVLYAMAQWNWKTYPGVDLTPKGNWRGGKPIENEAFLQQFWREHPP